MPTTQDIIAACKADWPQHQNDCSGFAKAVASRLGIPLTGLANDIVDHIRANWRVLPDGPAAIQAVAAGELVIAGLKGGEQKNPSAHGHLVIVVPGEAAFGRYPRAYWGRLGGGGQRDETLNFAWNRRDRDRITYAAAPSQP